MPKLTNLQIAIGLWIAACALAAIFGWTMQAHAEPVGDLYAFCDSTWAAPCDERALMLEDVCEDTIRTYTDGSKRFSCAPVNAATRDAYLATVDRGIRENTFRAWREGR